ncbi:hypothetical protein [Novosphingobium panipatense]|uniref:Lipoprotein n=1 Tax=Novosphingobium panipatense TaxID=428991 RepID=A0ABY1QFI6_9SPHN|nr:hypothetical protein [Novosphingobium panipatense]SMP69811.1 hypothetical protein SAMN06296065_105175 [Novosphingobium panipatense]
MKLVAPLPGLALLGALCVAACGPAEKATVPAESDPALADALNEPLMVDPDLSGQQGAALSAEGGRVTIPPQDRSPEAVEAARKAALQSAGGTLRPVPAPVGGGSVSLAQDAATAAQVAEQSRLAKTDCSASVQYSNTWAAKLPDAMPVYPRGAVQEAAGVDGQDCALRVVNFMTPVGVDDVLSFYFTKATAAGYTAVHRTEGKDHVLGGRKAGRAYVIYARSRSGALTEVDLVTSGR